jgi:hypothetical protein
MIGHHLLIFGLLKRSEGSGRLLLPWKNLLAQSADPPLHAGSAKASTTKRLTPP